MQLLQIHVANQLIPLPAVAENPRKTGPKAAESQTASLGRGESRHNIKCSTYEL